jgi:hypothetical protein
MPHKYSYRKGQPKNQSKDQKDQRDQRDQKDQTVQREYRLGQRQQRLRGADEEQTRTYLTKLIEQDAPLFNHSHLVLMYGPFQTEMAPEAGQGVASWIKDCIKKHGIPSLVRFDDRRRAQVFRRDQFQPWLEPLMDQAC